MPIDRGPGVIAEENKNQLTPETGELWVPFPDGSFPRSVTFEEVGAADGVHKALRLVVYDKARNVTMTFAPTDGPDPGGDFFVGSSAVPAPAPSGLLRGFDVASPAGLAAVIAALQAQWCGVYIGGPTNGGRAWTPDAVRALAPLLPDGFAPLYVGANIINGVLEAGPLIAANGYGHGTDAVQQLQNFGFRMGGGSPVIWFDIEENTWESDPAGALYYAEGCIMGARDSGAEGGVYGPGGLLRALTGRMDPVYTWLAAWDGNPAPEGRTIHQYRGETTVAGDGVDLDVAYLTDPGVLAVLA